MNMLFLVCIGFIMNIFPSNGSFDSEDEELLTTLLNTVMDLNTKICSLENEVTTLNGRITTLESELNNASIIPPYSVVNYAICVGRPQGISGDATIPSGNDDLRCSSGSVEVVGVNGYRDIGGFGIAPGPFTDPDFDIEGCEQQCLETAGCVAFNWIIDSNQFRCELYDSTVPNDEYQPQAIIFCVIAEDPCEIGEIITWIGTDETLPIEYRLTDGSTLSAEEYPDLCQIIDGICDTGCVLPHLSGRFISGATSTTTNEMMAELCEVGGDSTLQL